MKTLLYGDFKPTRLAASYQRAFLQLGHSVVPFDTNHLKSNLAFWLRSRLLHRATINSLVARRKGAAVWNQKLLKTVTEARPDLLFVLNGEFIMPETIKAVRQDGVPVFIFHADNPFPPHYNNRPETLPCALESDAYFIWSRQLVARLADMGVKNPVYLPFAWDAEIFPYREPTGEYEYDVVFIGGWDKEREAFLEVLAEKFDLKIWGPDYWQTRTRSGSRLKSCWQGKAVIGPEAAQILQRSRVCLNIVRQQNMPDGVIMRHFELPGCGAFGISTRTSGALEIFPEMKAGAYFSTSEECIDHISFFLESDLHRERIIYLQHKIIESEHKYTHRIEDILTYIKLA